MKIEHYKLHNKIEDEHWWFCARRTILKNLIQEILPPSKDVRIADIGCGTGGNLLVLSKYYSCIGLDSSKDAIDLAKKKNTKVPFMCGDSPQALNGMGNKINLVLMADVLEHVLEDQKLLENWVNFVEPGTYFIITVPAKPKLWSKHDVSFGHHRRYDLDSFQKLFTGLPVEILLSSYFNFYLYPFIKVMRFIKNQLSVLSGTRPESHHTDFFLPPHFFNKILENIFAFEFYKLLNLLRGKTTHGFSNGVSLICIFQKRKGTPSNA